MGEHRFFQVDVFSDHPARGNGLAVVCDADNLSTEDMQAFAAWTNLAETTFLFASDSPKADYAVRIFTPGREMPFAGHPTLGSCAAWLAAGGVPAQAGRVVQDCAIGLVGIDTTGAVPAFEAPQTRVAPMPEDLRAHLCAKMAIDPARVMRAALLDNGPSWQVLELASADDVLAIDSATVHWPEEQGVSVIGPHPEGAECDYEVRNLSPSSGMSEDPITGSLNATIARWMQSDGRLDRPLLVAQGTAIGRLGRVHIRPEGEKVLIGGTANVMIEGVVRL